MSFYVEISENGGLPSTRLVHHFYPVAAKPGTTRLAVDSLEESQPPEHFEVGMDYDSMKAEFVAGHIPRFDLTCDRR